MRGVKGTSDSGFIGVTADRQGWKVQFVGPSGKPFNLGSYYDPEIAACMFDEARKALDLPPSNGIIGLGIISVSEALRDLSWGEVQRIAHGFHRIDLLKEAYTTAQKTPH